MSTVENLCKVRETLEQIEKHPLFFYRSSLRHSVYTNRGMARLFKLSDEDCAYYLFEGVLAVGDLLARDLTGKGQFMFNSKLQSKIANGDTDLLNRVIDSLRLIVKNVQHYMPVNRMQIFPKKQLPNTSK